MDIQKIKEIALANGFSLKEQASGNMDLHSYVYEFANAIEQAAKAQAVPKKAETVYLVWNKSHCECVGFTDKQDAKYASTGRQTSMGYSSLAGEFREIYEDEMGGNKFDITEIQIQAQEPKG